MKILKSAVPLTLILALCLSACAMFEARKTEPAPMVPPKPISVPVGKNWKVIEEPPNLRDERDHVPFQSEQSVQPAGLSPVVPTVGATPVAPPDKRKLESPR